MKSDSVKLFWRTNVQHNVSDQIGSGNSLPNCSVLCVHLLSMAVTTLLLHP